MHQISNSPLQSNMLVVVTLHGGSDCFKYYQKVVFIKDQNGLHHVSFEIIIFR